VAAAAGSSIVSKKRSALRNHVEFAAFRMARGLIGLLSPAGLARVGDVVGNFFATLPGRRRQIIDFNLRLAFPDMTDDERRGLAYAVTRHFARSALDAIRIQRLRPEELLATVDVVGWDNVDRVLSHGQGVFFLTAHIGSWEVAGLVTGLKVESGLAVVNRPLDNPLLEVELDRLRRLYGNHVFGKHNIVREVLAQLKKGGGVGILIDQRVREDRGVEVPFFHHAAWTPGILARLARKTGAPVVPTFALRDKPGHYVLRYDQPVVLDDLSEAELEEVPLTTRYMAILEAAIRKNPDQWLWYHDRWRQLRLRKDAAH
jgi:KDO2-lipid IV(A) lauroyltransferase